MDVSTATGNAGKPRILSAAVDNLLASVCGIILAINTSQLGGAGQGTVLVVTYLAFFVVQEGIWGRTIGKALFGLIIIRLDGRRAGWREVIPRTLLRIIEVNPLLFGAIPAGLMVLLSSRNQRLGDMLARTVVTRHNMHQQLSGRGGP